MPLLVCDLWETFNESLINLMLFCRFERVSKKQDSKWVWVSSFWAQFGDWCSFQVRTREQYIEEHTGKGFHPFLSKDDFFQHGHRELGGSGCVGREHGLAMCTGHRGLVYPAQCGGATGGRGLSAGSQQPILVEFGERRCLQQNWTDYTFGEETVAENMC